MSNSENLGSGAAQIVFIDANVPDLQDLLDGLAPGVQAFVLDPDSSGLQQIAAILTANDFTDLSVISIVGHGSPGAIDIGGTTLDDSDLSAFAADLQQIGAALTPGGTLQLYACDTAAGASGQQFIADLADYVGGAGVAASDQSIGQTAGGENWVLDQTAGSADAAASAPFTAEALASFDGTLAGATVTATQTTVLTTDADHDGGISPGDTVTTSVVVTNTGTAPATNVSLSETLTGETMVGGTLSVGGTSVGGTLSSVLIGTLPAGASTTVSWESTINSQSDQLIAGPTNSGTVSGGDFNTTVTNNDTVTLNTLTLSGEIFDDANNNGILDTGESGIGGVGLLLIPQGGESGAALETTVTDANGDYSFTGLAAGSYIVRTSNGDFLSIGGLAGYSNSSTVVDGTPNDYLGGRNYGEPIAGGIIYTNPITIAYDSPHPTGATTYPGDDTTATLDIGVVHTSPTLSVLASTTYFYSESAVLLSPSANVSDDSNDLTSATVQITGGTFPDDGDQLAATTTGTGITASYDPTSETLTLTGPSSVTLFMQVLRSVTFDSTNPEPTDNGADPTRTITWTVNDGNSYNNITTTSETVDITPCYCPGTLIRTDDGEKPVEALRIGDFVMTASGAARPIKWIGRRSYGGRFILGRTDILPVCIKASALGDNMPKRDLWISPHHAMFFKEAGRAGVLIEAKDLVNGVSVVQAERVAKVEYFHIELDSHDVIIAEGALSESFIDDDNRGLFHNAREFEALYPSEAAPTTACYCAPRLEEGFEVEMVRRRIAERAGLLRAADAPRLGELNGCVEEVGASRITGWAQTDGQSEAPVCLDVYAGGVLMGQTLANKYRADLAQVGVGSGRHGFVFTPPQGMDHGVVEVRRSLDGALLQSFQPNTTRAANVPAGLRRDALNVTVHRRVARL